MTGAVPLLIANCVALLTVLRTKVDPLDERDPVPGAMVNAWIIPPVVAWYRKAPEGSTVTEEGSKLPVLKGEPANGVSAPVVGSMA